jgi:nicotinate-nucleotide adenylyltransferase
MDEPNLWHAIAGAKYAREVLEITDPDIINAIRFHTVSRANMSMVEKLVFISDWISVDRIGEDSLRALAFENLDLAVFNAIKAGLLKNIRKNRKTLAYTYNAYNYYNEKAVINSNN